MKKIYHPSRAVAALAAALACLPSAMTGIEIPLESFGKGSRIAYVNMHKVFIVAAYTIVAIAFFASSGNVLWLHSVILAVAMSAGGWIGTHVVVAKGEGVIRLVLNVALIVMIVKLLV